MKVVAVGSRAFVSGFRLAGISGIKVSNPDEALREVTKLTRDMDIGLVLISDDISKEIRNRLNELRAKIPVPLLYEIPSPGSKKEKFEYRDMLKQILGV